MHNAKGLGGRLMLPLLIGLTSHATAAVNPQFDKDGFLEPGPSPYSYVAAISAGPTWANGGKTQTILLTPGIEKAYVANNTSSTLFDGEIFLGVQRVLTDRITGQLGLAVAATSSAKLAGPIWDDALPEFSDSVYSYNVYHTHVAAKGKFLTDIPYVKPYISASVGVGFNRAQNFTSTPTIYAAMPTPNFTSNTTTTFTYTVGAGVQREITKNWQVGVGYEFADWGRSQLGRAPGQTLGNGLVLNNLYTNGLMINLTYVS